MSKKFTEEQYQKIVETVNKYPDFGSVYYVQNGWNYFSKRKILGVIN